MIPCPLRHSQGPNIIRSPACLGRRERQQVRLQAVALPTSALPHSHNCDHSQSLWALKHTSLHSPLVLQYGSQVAGLVPRGSTGINHMGAGNRAEQEGREAAGLQENKPP